ncbi:MAG: DHA2 family efflux MFS transporter permease subunit [Actinomycetota bacterium]|nr:DHA2 family efflux MFS transporter permease subunit [Actinomycetota bacterium]
MTDKPEGLYARRWWTLGVLCLSLLIVFVGNSSLNVAIPTLSRDLHASTSQLQWVVAAYSLVFAGLLFTAGALGDRFGRKGALQLGLLGFLVGVALASASTQMWELIACRALMGACAAFIMPSTLSILVNIFPADERAKAIAIWAGVTGAAGAIGPVASGWLLGHYWFGSVFLVNVPIILAALVLGTFLVPRSKDPDEARLDPVGAALSVIGISSLVYGLIQAPDKGWSSPQTLAAFAIGLGVLVVFVLWERARAEPMLDMSFFRNPAFSTATGGMILVFLSMFGVLFLITQYFQLILHYSPLSAALRFLPMAPIMMFVSPLTPRIIARLGHNRTVAAGMGFVAVGFVLFSRLGVATPYSYVLLCVFFLVSGIALTMSPMTAAIMSAVPPRRAGAGSAMNDATRELGAALGVAVLGSIAASRYGSGLGPSLVSLSPTDQVAARTSLAGALQTAGHLPAEAAARLVSAADHAFVSGIHVAAMGGAILAASAALIVLRFLPRHIDQHGADRTSVEALEDVVELGIAGVPPVFAEAGPPSADRS